MRRFLVTALLALFLAAPAASAQESGSTWFTIFVDHVDISNHQAFEAAGREFTDLFRNAGVEVPGWVTITGADLGYTYAVPGQGPGDLEAMNESWGAAMQAIGAAGTRVMAESDALVERREVYFLQLRPDLSYKPETVGLTPETPFRHYVQLKVHPAKTQEFEAAAKAWADAYARHGIERGFRVYQYATGSDLPMYLIVEHAKDEAQFHAAGAEIERVLGPDMEALYAQTGPSLRSVREMTGRVRPELSYSPASGGS